jgi:hypothetical protein
VTVTKIGFGVCTGIDLLLDAVDLAGVDVTEGVVLLVFSGATTVVVTACVMVGPGLTTSTVVVDLMTDVACAPSLDPPSTLMTE